MWRVCFLFFCWCIVCIASNRCEQLSDYSSHVSSQRTAADPRPARLQRWWYSHMQHLRQIPHGLVLWQQGLDYLGTQSYIHLPVREHILSSTFISFRIGAGSSHMLIMEKERMVVMWRLLTVKKAEDSCKSGVWWWWVQFGAEAVH